MYDGDRIEASSLSRADCRVGPKVCSADGRRLRGLEICVGGVNFATGCVGHCHGRTAILHHLLAALIRGCWRKAIEPGQSCPEHQNSQHEDSALLPHTHSVYLSSTNNIVRPSLPGFGDLNHNKRKAEGGARGRRSASERSLQQCLMPPHLARWL